jgi:TldD protein
MALNAACIEHPGVISARFLLNQEYHHKSITNSVGSDVVNQIASSFVNITLISKNADGVSVKLGEPIYWKGNLADYDWSPKALANRLAILAEHLQALPSYLQAKRKAVMAKGGMRTVIISPNISGVLAHEAMGHPCEADLVLSGAITSGLRHKRIASDLVSKDDYSHHHDGKECLIPV